MRRRGAARRRGSLGAQTQLSIDVITTSSNNFPARFSLSLSDVCPFSGTRAVSPSIPVSLAPSAVSSCTANLILSERFRQNISSWEVPRGQNNIVSTTIHEHSSKSVERPRFLRLVATTTLQSGAALKTRYVKSSASDAHVIALADLSARCISRAHSQPQRTHVPTNRLPPLQHDQQGADPVGAAASASVRCITER